MTPSSMSRKSQTKSLNSQSREYLIDSSVPIPDIRHNQAFVARLDARLAIAW
jgi:hypothetical protein